MSDFRVHSFDTPRERSAPLWLHGRLENGEAVSIEFDGLTLIVAVKPHCDGCQGFLFGDLHELSNVRVVLVSATSGANEWEGSRQPVVVAPTFMAELDIRSAPYYVVIDAGTAKVVGEGTLFSPQQVALEIAPLLVS